MTVTPAAVASADVFVSYRRSIERDRTWVWEVLVPRLDDEGLEVVVDDRSFAPGDTVIESMAKAVDASRITIAVLTPAYLQSGFTHLERIMAQHVGLEQGTKRLVGLMLEPCELPTELRPFLWIDVTAVAAKDDQVLDRLVRTIYEG
jgi:TIR domain